MIEDNRDPICMEADGIGLEIDLAPGATALDDSLANVITSAITAANAAAGPVHGAVTVLVDDDQRIRELNRVWRGFDKPTNVLSFPAPDTPPGPSPAIGDIAISYETAVREAAAEGKTLGDHMAHLSVHGFLHLLGYDHESDEDAEEMEGLERDILARLGIADPYVAREPEG